LGQETNPLARVGAVSRLARERQALRSGILGTMSLHVISAVFNVRPALWLTTRYESKGSLKHLGADAVDTIRSNAAGAVWVGSSAGLKRFEANGRVQAYGTNEDLLELVMHEDRRGADKSTDRDKANAEAIMNDGRMPYWWSAIHGLQRRSVLQLL
jgi:hypothetical protein